MKNIFLYDVFLLIFLAFLSPYAAAMQKEQENEKIEDRAPETAIMAEIDYCYPCSLYTSIENQRIILYGIHFDLLPSDIKIFLKNKEIEKEVKIENISEYGYYIEIVLPSSFNQGEEPWFVWQLGDSKKRSFTNIKVNFY